MDPTPAPPRPTTPNPAPPPRVGLLATAITSGFLLLVLIAASGLLWRSISQTNDDVAELRSQLTRTDQTIQDLTEHLSTVEAQQAEDFDPTTLVSELAPSVFVIEAPIDETTVAQGSAFVLGKDGRRSLFVTNYHVVAERWEAGAHDVVLTRGNRAYDGTIIQVDAAADLALVQVDAELPVLEAAETSPKVGDPVMVIGTGAGLEGSVTTGVVSALDREIEGQTYIQFSAQVNPGNSGGPLFDADGKVIGVVTGKLVDIEVEGVSFAIPIETACTLFSLC